MHGELYGRVAGYIGVSLMHVGITKVWFGVSFKYPDDLLQPSKRYHNYGVFSEYLTMLKGHGSQCQRESSILSS